MYAASEKNANESESESFGGNLIKNIEFVLPCTCLHRISANIFFGGMWNVKARTSEVVDV